MPTFRLDHTAFHLAVDMQRLFAEPIEWNSPWMLRILPKVAAITEHAQIRTSSTEEILAEWASAR